MTTDPGFNITGCIFNISSAGIQYRHRRLILAFIVILEPMIKALVFFDESLVSRAAPGWASSQSL
jgi:hypothetical protein